MSQLVTLYLDAVGHPDARFEAMQISSRRADGRPASTVYLLRNGGGKTTIISLILSVLLPSARDFTGRADKRTLETYVLPGDISIVATEWTIPSDPESRTRIVGVAMTRRNGEEGGLRRLMFSFIAGGRSTDLFNPLAGTDPLQSMPFKGLGERAKSLAEFTAWLREEEKKSPERDFKYTESQEEWADFLRKRHFDLKAISIMAAMNKKEGGGSESIMNFKDDKSFVDFAIEQLLDTESASLIRKNIGSLQSAFKETDTMMTRINFANTIKPMLAAAGSAYQDLKKAEKSLQDIEDDFDKIVMEAFSAIRFFEAQKASQAALSEKFMQSFREAFEAAESQISLALALRNHAATVRLRAAEISKETAFQKRVQKNRTAAAAMAGPSASRLRQAKAETKAAEDNLRLALEPFQEIQAKLEMAKARLAAALGKAVSTRKDEWQAATSAAEQAMQNVKTSRSSSQEERKKLTLTSEHARKAREKAQRFIVEANLLRDANILMPDQSLQDALTYWTEQSTQAKNATRAAYDNAAEAKSKADDADRARQDFIRIAKTHRENAASTEAAMGKMLQLKAQLLAHTACPLVVDGIVEFDPYESGISGRISIASSQRKEEAKEARVKRDAAMSLHDDIENNLGLLPLSRDTNDVVHGLRDLGINAHHYARYLAENGSDPHEIEEMIRRDPARYGGVVVIGSDAMSKAISFKPARNFSSPVQITNVDADEIGVADGRIVVGIRSECFDATIAKETSELAKIEADHHDERARQLYQEADILENLGQMLASFLIKYPEGWEAEQTRSLNAEIDAAQTADSNRLAAENEKAESLIEMSDYKSEAAEAEKLSLTVQGNIRKINTIMTLYSESPEELNAMASDLEAQASLLEKSIAEFEKAAADAEVWAQNQRDMASQANQEVIRLTEEFNRLGSITAESDESIGLEDARAAYTNLCKLADQALPDMMLQAALEMAKKQEEQATRAFESDRKRVAPGESELTDDEILVWIDATEAAIKLASDEAETAQHDFENTLKAFGKAESAAEDAKRVMTAASLSVEIDSELDDHAADIQAAACDAKAVEVQAKAADSKMKASVADSEIKSLDARVKYFRALVNSRTTPKIDPNSPILEPNKTDEEFQKLLKDGQNAINAATSVRNQRQANLSRTEKRVVGCAQDTSRWGQHLDSMPRRVNEANERGVIGESAERFIADIEGMSIYASQRIHDAELASDGVARDLDIHVEDIRRALKRFSSVSRVPEMPSLGGWAGKSFIEVTVDGGEDPVTRISQLKHFVLSMCSAPTLPDETEIIKRAFRACMPREPKVTMLKPGLAMDTHRHPIGAVMGASGGEKLTAAILLYSAMRRLSGSRSSGGEGGTLLLDNPIGTCSLVPLLNLQRRVAEEAKVQLVFTTALNDFEAIRVFPIVFSLKNEKIERRSGRKYVMIEEKAESPSMETAKVEFKNSAW